jgi:hypothetical protein
MATTSFTIEKWGGNGKFGGAAFCAMTDGMVVARIARVSAINDHRRAFKFSLTFWFFCGKTKEHEKKSFPIRSFSLMRKNQRIKKIRNCLHTSFRTLVGFSGLRSFPALQELGFSSF